MHHLPDLIRDLGVILIVAAAVTLLFKRVKQPVVLGYLLAGFLVGPHVPFFPTVTDTKSVGIWAEIGVIFLLFGLGLEFSFKKLAAVGKSASVTASVEIFSMLAAGFITGRVLGWSTMDSLFLGGILSISSTTIIVRAFDEMGLKGKAFASLVFGALIVEDLIAILLMVLLSSVAVTQTLAGGELLSSSVRLIFFMVLWFILGIYLLPTMLNRLRPLLSDESMLIVSIGLCLMMVIVASHAGFSPALGAFVMGSLFAETRDGHKIEKLILPVKDLFAAVFFVSVGMLLNPAVLHEHFWVILLITAVTVVGKILSTTFGALLSGKNLKTSVQAGMSLAQIGEFSFIIATLGVSLKVTSDFLYPIAVAVSAITTFTTPYLIKYSGPLSQWLDSSLPQPIKTALFKYETAMASGNGDNALSLVWQEYGMKLIFNAVIVVAITLATSRWALPWLLEMNVPMASLVACVIALVLTAPFLWAIFVGRRPASVQHSEETLERLRRLQFGVALSRLLIGGALIGFVVGQFTSVLAFSGVILITTAGVGAFLFSRFSEPIYQMMEGRFMSNLTEIEREALAKRANRPELAPWDARLMELTVSPSSPLVAKSLGQTSLRDRYGVTVAMIQRGEKHIVAPGRDELLLPFDRLSVIGGEDQLSALQTVLEAQEDDSNLSAPESFGLMSVAVEEGDSFAGVVIRESGLREKVNGLVVGIERSGRRILNPDPSIRLEQGDLVWIVGDRNRIKILRSLST